MPNIKSAMKRMRTSARQAEANRRIKTRITTMRRKFMSAVSHGDKAAGQLAYDAFASTLDKAAKSGTIKRNTADRSKSRAHNRLASLS